MFRISAEKACLDQRATPREVLLVERTHVRFRERCFSGRKRGHDPAKHSALERIAGLLDQTTSIVDWILARGGLNISLANEEQEGGWRQRHPDVI